FINGTCWPFFQAVRISYGVLLSARDCVRDGIARSATTASATVLEVPVLTGMRFAEVRARVTMAEVLGLIGFVPCERSGDQVRGPCPVHHSATPAGRSFS